MLLFIPLVIIVFVVAAMASQKTPRSRKGSDTFFGGGFFQGVGLSAVPIFVNNAEKQAWSLLQATELGQTAVFAKVRIEDIVKVSAVDRRRQWSERGRIKSRHVDFLLVDRNWMPLLVVEVDGASHQREDRRSRDEMVDAAMAKAGIPILHLRVGQDWRSEMMRWQESVGRPATGSPSPH